VGNSPQLGHDSLVGHSTEALNSVEHKPVVTVLVKFSSKLNGSDWAMKYVVCNLGCL